MKRAIFKFLEAIEMEERVGEGQLKFLPIFDRRNTYAVFTMIREATHLCRDMRSSSGTFVALTEPEFEQLAEGPRQMEEGGFNLLSESLLWCGISRSGVGKNSVLVHAAVEAITRLSYSEYCGINALLAIDRALEIASTGNSRLDASDAICAMAQAYEYLRMAHDKALENAFQRCVSELAAARAKKRHAKNAAAKAFIKEEWERYREDYKNNKSDFARVYVRIVKMEFGIDFTEKTIRDVWLKTPRLHADR